MVTLKDKFSTQSQYDLVLTVTQSSRIQSSNESNISWTLDLAQNSGSGYYWLDARGSKKVVINGSQVLSGSVPALDFRTGGDSKRLGSGSLRVKHNADGNKKLSISAEINVGYPIGNASVSGTMTLVRIPKVPGKPTALGVDQITQTTVRFRFQGNSDNGGSAITEWQVGYGTNPNSPTNTVKSTGTSTITGLIPGTKYYFWGRGKNAIGWGPWSNSASATTLPGGRVRIGGVWKSATPYVRVNGVWKMAIPYVRSNGTWKVSG